jgi:hypothetical protein
MFISKEEMKNLSCPRYGKECNEFMCGFSIDGTCRQETKKKIRNPERLDDFYLQLCEIHKKSFPDMREGQFLLNALGYINSTLKRDPFFSESNEMINLFKQYANSNSMLYQEWDILGSESKSGEN